MPTELEDPPVYCDESCCLRDLGDRGFAVGEASIGVVERCERCQRALEAGRYELWAFHPFTNEDIPEPLPIAEPRAFCSEFCAREALADRGLEVRSLTEVFSSRSRTLRARLGRLVVLLRVRRSRR